MKISYTIMAIVFLFSSSSVQAQEADKRIGDLINQSDWFGLEKEYALQKDSIRNPILRFLSEAMLGSYFNRPDAACEAIDSLLTHYQDQIGFENSCSMVYFASENQLKQEKYESIIEILEPFIEQTKDILESQEQYLTYYKMANALRHHPRTEIMRPDRDCSVPLTIEKAGRGSHLYVPVEINEKEYPFIFDTGAGYNMVSERFAQEIGIRTVCDSFPITGVSRVFGKLGITDSIRIGDILYKNPLFLIAPPIAETDSIFQVDAVLGSPFMLSIGETQINMSESKITFPICETPLPESGRNLTFQSGQPYLQVISNGEKLLFHFDTGDVEGNLHSSFYEKHQEWVKANGVKETLRGGGLGGLYEVESYRLSSYPMQIGGTNCELKNVSVSTQKTCMIQREEDGVLGFNFINLFPETIINFRQMFVLVNP